MGKAESRNHELDEPEQDRRRGDREEVIGVIRVQWTETLLEGKEKASCALARIWRKAIRVPPKGFAQRHITGLCNRERDSKWVQKDPTEQGE